MSEQTPLVDNVETLIVMHRECHFGGSFPLMLEYYRKGGIGSQPDFSIEQIEKLAEIELTKGENLALLLLSGAEAEKVAQARNAYKLLKKIYELSTVTPARLIADLILSEKEEPDSEMEAIINLERAAIPALIDVIRSDEFHDPLFPGYGRAPSLASKCLGKIGNPSAIKALFEAVHETDFFEEDSALEALKCIGAPARDFLIKILLSKPIRLDNERAAVALIQFEDDPIVAESCFTLLNDPAVRKLTPLSTYLVLGCSAIRHTPMKGAFIALSQDKSIDPALRQDMRAIISSWSDTL